MTLKYDSVSLSVGIDHNYPIYGRYEYVIFAPNDGPILTRDTGYKSAAQARRAGMKATEPFLLAEN